MSGGEGLDVRGLVAGYTNVPVIHGLDMSVAPGEVVALLGPNGAGKSTSIMGMAGLLSGTSGEVSVNGETLSGPAYRRCQRSLGVVLEGRSIFPGLNVTHNLTAGGVSAADALRVFPELEPLLERQSGLLSGGQQQMLSLARAICRRPRALLIDELSFGLAPATCDRLFGVLREVASQQDMAILLVEQHVRHAEKVADRALVMSHGRVQLEMDVSELTSREQEIADVYLLGAAHGAA